MRARYRITAPLGRGKRVFRGVAELSGGRARDVAIMRVVPSLTKNQKFVAMLLDDMRSSLSLHHSNIVEVVDIARTLEDEYFVVTEYVDGCDLETIVSRRKRIELAHALHIIVESCRGLAHAHSFGAVHRDLSPRVVLLGTNGEVKLLDFGLAKANSQIESSDPGLVKGKFSYLSPEAASGVDVDHRADVFAAGIVLWELVAGRRLFLGPTDYQTVELIRAARVPAIEDVDPALDSIIRKALARDVVARFATAAELGNALDRYSASRDMKPARDEAAKLVSDVKFKVDAERSNAFDHANLARVQESVNRMVSIIGDDGGGRWN
jgi:serine/threonine-protein kinase